MTSLIPIEDVVQLLLTQNGWLQGYLFGGKPPISCPDLRAADIRSDCSGFIDWGTGRKGKQLAGGSGQQLATCRAAGLEIPLTQAVKTRGALGFRPADGSEHVVMFLGNGMTIEARGAAYGIGSWSATQGRDFAAGALIPGFDYSTPAPPNGDGDLTPEEHTDLGTILANSLATNGAVAIERVALLDPTSGMQHRTTANYVMLQEIATKLGVAPKSLQDHAAAFATGPADILTLFDALDDADKQTVAVSIAGYYAGTE
jgi:cell wall-associated NlpC family hydrolase